MKSQARTSPAELSRLSALERAVFGSAQATFDVIPWVQSRLGLTLDEWQKNVLVSEARRLLLVCPRQSGKSTTIGALAGAAMVSRPDTRVVIVSPTQRQSGLLAMKVADVIRDENIISESATRLVLANGSTLDSLPGDRPSSVRGPTADLLLIDEASRVRKELVVAALPMTAASDGRVVLLSTPAGSSGSFYNFWSDTSDEWEKTFVTVADVGHYSDQVLKSMKRRLGPRMWEQEFEGKFLEAPGALFSEDSISALMGSNTWDGALIPTSSSKPFVRLF